MILIIKLVGMKRLLCFSILFAASVWAEELPPAPQILAAARAQLPSHPVHMTGVLKLWTANGFMKKALDVDMEIDWRAESPSAAYRISDEAGNFFQTLEISWKNGQPEYLFSQSGENGAFDPHAEIENMGLTWSDLSFSFLWSQEAQTLGIEKKFGKERFVISVPRPEGHSLRLWVEKETGRLVKAEEYDADGIRQKIIKVVSVKEFDGLWMVKDLDIIRLEQGGRTSLRIDRVEARN